jgi:hypothetical protein
MAEGGVALLNAAHAAKAYPTIRHSSGDEGITAEAMRKALQREWAADRCAPAKCGTIPYREYSLGKCPALRITATISYLLKGRGQSPQTAVVDLSVVPDPKAWLEKRLGPVKWCNTDEDEPPPEPPSPPPPEPRPPAPPPPGGRRPDPVSPIPEPRAAALLPALPREAVPITLAAKTTAAATASAAIAEAEDAEPGDTADALPFAVMSEPPPLLLRRLAERAGGRAPPVAVLEPVPVPVEHAAHPFALFAAEFLAAMGSEARAPDG